jgi:hypothetical protein
MCRVPGQKYCAGHCLTSAATYTRRCLLSATCPPPRHVAKQANQPAVEQFGGPAVAYAQQAAVDTFNSRPLLISDACWEATGQLPNHRGNPSAACFWTTVVQLEVLGLQGVLGVLAGA